MSASLVGSEMCIRDSRWTPQKTAKDAGLMLHAKATRHLLRGANRERLLAPGARVHHAEHSA
eukprot:7142847-Alexandrium_andersonii.AAC.1